MGNINADVIRVELATEASAAGTLKPKMMAYAKDTRRLVWMEGDSTLRYAWDSTRLADQTGSWGAAVIGSAGITGITPNGGSSGSAATLANMLTGIRDSVVLKSPYNSTINTIQPTADYTPLTLNGFAAGVSDLLDLQAASTTVAWFDNKANLTLSRSDAGNAVSIRIINSDNTNPASVASLLLNTAGSSSGDPFVRHANGSQNWSSGIDVSDGLKYKVSEAATLGTNDAILINPGGSIILNRATTITSQMEAQGNVYTSGTGTGYWLNTPGTFTYGMYTSGGSLLFRSGSTTPYLTVNSSGQPTFANAVSMSGNFTVSRAAAGSTVLATISNTDNTNSNSNTELLISTGGASGGEPYIRITNGTDDWAIGAHSGNFEIGNAAVLGGNVVLSINHTTRVVSFPLAGVTFTAAPVFSSVTASQILAVDGSKSLVSIATTGTGSVMLATAPTIATSLTLSYATINTAAAFDASKNLISVAITGSGDAVYSASPTLTGTLTAAIISASGDLTVSRSQASTPVSIALTNTSSSAGADARLAISVAAAAAGNPFVSYITNGGGLTWSIGGDNADSGKFKISKSTTLGTNDALTIDTSLIASFRGSISLDGSGTYFRFPRGTSDPTSPLEGWAYWNTSGKHLFIHNGTTWLQIV